MRKGWVVLIVATATSLAVVAAATLQNIAGTVSDPGANALPGIRVELFDAVNAELLASATTDASGRYDSGNIPTGDYRVRLSDPTEAYGPEFYGAGGIDFFCDGTIVPVLSSTTTDLDMGIHALYPIEDATAGPVSVTLAGFFLHRADPVVRRERGRVRERECAS